MPQWKNKEEYEAWKTKKFINETTSPSEKKFLESKNVIEKIKALPLWVKFFIGLISWWFGVFLIGNSWFALLYALLFPFIYYQFVVKKPLSINFSKTKQIYCPNCKYKGAGEYTTKGSFGIELILWLCLLLPGLIYSVWRLTTRGYTCPQCGFNYVVQKGHLIE